MACSWGDLAKFGLIDHAPAFNGDYPNDCVPAADYAVASRQFPIGKIGRDSFMGYLYIDGGLDLFVLAAFNADFVTASGLTGTLPVLSPSEAFSIDAKMDDGQPLSGRVLGGGLVDMPPVTIWPGVDGTCVEDTGDPANEPYFTRTPERAEDIGGLFFIPRF